MRSVTQDFRYALRQLRKSPGFALTTLLTIALAVGAVTSVFSVVNAVLLQPYAFHDSGQVVVWRESIREIQNVAPLLPDNYRHYLNLKTQAKSIQDAAILQTAGFSVSTGVDHPQMAEGLAVSPNFFAVLGVRPLLGRSFIPAEAQSGRDAEIILTWGAWQRLFHGDSSVLGRTLRVDGEAKTIVGVLPRSFRFPVLSIMPGEATFGSTERYELFKPLAPRADELTANDAEFNFLVVARLKPGVSVQQAQSELDGIEKSTAAADHLAIHLSVIVEPFSQEITGDVSRPLWLLLAAVMSVLLMACVNLANLQIARSVARDHETALRSALGAGRVRLLQSVLAENLLLGLGGGVGGIFFAISAEKILLRVAAVLPRINEVHLSVPMLAFTIGLSVATSLAFGLLPALRSLQIAPQGALQLNSARLSGSKQRFELAESCRCRSCMQRHFADRDWSDYAKFFPPDHARQAVQRAACIYRPRPPERSQIFKGWRDAGQSRSGPEQPCPRCNDRSDSRQTAFLTWRAVCGNHECGATHRGYGGRWVGTAG